MVVKNNLGEHLTWLNTTKANIPVIKSPAGDVTYSKVISTTARSLPVVTSRPEPTVTNIFQQVEGRKRTPGMLSVRRGGSNGPMNDISPEIQDDLIDLTQEDVPRRSNSTNDTRKRVNGSIDEISIKRPKNGTIESRPSRVPMSNTANRMPPPSTTAITNNTKRPVYDDFTNDSMLNDSLDEEIFEMEMENLVASKLPISTNTEKNPDHPLLAKSKEELIQSLRNQNAYIELCQEKIRLLESRANIAESRSLSEDQKVSMRLGVTPTINSISEKMSTLERNLPKFDLDKELDLRSSQVLGKFNSDSNLSFQSTPIRGRSSPILAPTTAQVIHTVPSNSPSLDQIVVNKQFNHQERIGVSLDSHSLIEVPETSLTEKDQHQINIQEARQVVQQARVDANQPRNQQQYDSDVEPEDNMGEHTMDGLFTPDGSLIDEGSDLEDFLVNDEDDRELIDDSYVDFEDGDGVTVKESIEDSATENEDFTVDGEELENLKLSQDVANKFQVVYGDNSLIHSGIKPLNRDIDDLIDEFEMDEEENDDEDIQILNEQYLTQLNNEREIIDHDESDIEIINEEEFSKDLINTKTVNETVADGKSQLDFDDPDLMSDGELEEIEALKKDERYNYPWSREVKQVLNNVFNLQSFRSNQLEAVNATLEGKDVFVLMPTGGGKSLCYQLPSLVKSGKTKGTTIVVSPLISLMQDQVMHLKNRNIAAEMINSKASAAERKAAFGLFLSGQLDLIYLSPEMIGASNQARNVIQRLYDNKQLARIVVDEAHCVSSWGHDFRPDYKTLNYFKNQYPEIPMMALTATANEKVRLDIMHNLNMNQPCFFKQSFNRTNLFYHIQWKDKDHLDNIRSFIMNKYRRSCGVIYCHSKNSCEQTSEKLNEIGLQTAFYHAGMSTEDRNRVQLAWQKDEISIICATIAFGMGIDKPDVRFVIHLTLPRTLEGYYQETGRAGRDGNPSECIMFYSYRDARTLQTMIQRDQELDRIGKENHLNKLRQVVQYCENATDCRRKQVLLYFNEVFDPKNCNKQCDNCANGSSLNQIEKDVTTEAKEIINLVRSVQEDKVTLLHCQDLYKGSRNSKILSLGHDSNPYHGKGKEMDKGDIERIFFHLISEEVLQEYSVMNGAGFASNYMRLGRHANAVLNNRKPIKISFSTEKRSMSKTKSNGTERTLTGPRQQNGNNGSAISAFRYDDNQPRQAVAGSSGFATASFIHRQMQGQNNVLTPIKVPAMNVPSQRMNDHIEKSYDELNNIRIQKMADMGFKASTTILSDASLRELAIRLTTNKRDFSKLPGVTKEQVEFFVYFKKVLETLKKQRNSDSRLTEVPASSNPSEGTESPFFTPNTGTQSSYNYSKSTGRSASGGYGKNGRGGGGRGFKSSQRGGRSSQRGGSSQRRGGSQRGGQRSRSSQTSRKPTGAGLRAMKL